MTSAPTTLPMTLTIARLIAAPLIALLIMGADAATLSVGADIGATLFGAALVLFALAALTDAADGFLARRMGATSALGAALDHTADKALTSCVLVALAATIFSRDMAVAAIILVGRDVAIGGLREGLALSGRALPVSQGGKIKTALILVGIGAALLLQTMSLAGGAAGLAQTVLDKGARATLWAGVALSVWSGVAYVLAALRPHAATATASAAPRSGSAPGAP
jgi:cardiolipin synthase